MNVSMLGPARGARRLMGPLAWASVFRPPRPAATIEGWLLGDCHIHSDISDGLVPLEKQVEWAATNGHGWIAITDHSDGVSVSVTDYAHRCEAASRHFGIPVLPSTEITTVMTEDSDDVGGDLVLLAAAPVGELSPKQALTAAQLLRLSKRPQTLQVVAHPCVGPKKWGWWDAKSIEAIELVTGTGRVEEQVLERWFSLGEQRLALGLRWSTGLGGSDGHAPWQTPARGGGTWVRVRDSHSPAGIIAAMKDGQALVCTHGDFGLIHFGDGYPGSSIRAAPTLTGTTSITPAADRECVAIAVFDEHRVELARAERPVDGTTLTFDADSARVLIAQLIFEDVRGGRRGEVWANPIYLVDSGRAERRRCG